MEVPERSGASRPGFPMSSGNVLSTGGEGLNAGFGISNSC